MDIKCLQLECSKIALQERNARMRLETPPPIKVLLLESEHQLTHIMPNNEYLRVVQTPTLLTHGN